MMIDDPRDDPNSDKHQMIIKIDAVFTVLFTMECVVKLIALGAYHRFYVPQKSVLVTMDQSDLVKGVGYFQNGWNVLDFVIVVESIVSSFADTGGNISGLRTFRVLRPLRAINKLPGLKLLIGAIMDSIPLLINTLIGFVIFFLIFDILAVQLWNGQFINRCYIDDLATFNEGDQRICNPEGGLHKCADGESCRPYTQNPNFGTTSFDNVIWGFLQVFQCITLEGWTDIMYQTQDIESYATLLYFIPLVLTGTYILLNLVLAAIVYKFNEASQIFLKEQKFKKMKRYMYLFENKKMQRNIIRSAFYRWIDVIIQENEQLARNRRGSTVGAAVSEVVAEGAAIIGKLVRKGSQESIRMSRKLSAKIMSRAKIIPDSSEDSNGRRMRGPPSSTLINSTKKLSGKNTTNQDIVVVFNRKKRLGVVGTVRKIFKRWSHEEHRFSKVMLCCIVLNTAVLSMDSYNMSTGLANFIQSANTVFFWIFALELVIKLIGLGPVEYANDRFNLFDALIVLFSAVELTIDTGGGKGAKTGSTTAFRTVRIFRLFRVLRIAKLARHLKFLQQMMKVIGESIASVAYAFLLLVLFIFIFSILGVQLFAGKMHTGAEILEWEKAGVELTLKDRQLLAWEVGNGEMRNNFDGILMAIISVFQCLTGEEWNKIMYHAMHSTSDGAALYFIMWIIVGKFTLLPVFLAVLLKRDEIEEPDPSEKDVRKRSILSIHSAKVMTQSVANGVKGGVTAAVRKGRHSMQMMEKGLKYNAAGDRRISLRIDQRLSVDFGNVDLGIGRNLNQLQMIKNQSNFFISRKSHEIVTNPYFENGILILIGLSAVALASETPDSEGNLQKQEVLRILEIIFTTLFSIEVILKVLAFGWIKYITDGWNLIDITVVVTSIVNLVIESSMKSGGGGEALESVRVLRLTRTLRPLRLISRYAGMKLVVEALIMSMLPLLSVLSVLLLVWLMFAIMGVQLYGGKFRHCTDPNFPPNAHFYSPAPGFPSGCNGTYTAHDGSMQERLIDDAPLNFNNVRFSMLTLFTMSSLEGWPTIMWLAVDSTEIDFQPVKNHNTSQSLFFIFFLILGSFFFLNLFVLTIFTNFLTQKHRQEGLNVLTTEQKQWIRMQKILMTSTAVIRQKAPGHWFRKKCFKLVTRSWFETAVMCLIGLNIVVMAMTHADMSAGFQTFLDASNVFFVVVYGIEAILKLCGLGIRGYFDDAWNQFDCLLVLLSIIDLILLTFTIEVKGGPTLLRIIRLTRLARILRVAKKADGLRKTFLTIYLSIPSLRNVGLLLLLVFFIFGVLGVNLFGKVEESDVITDHANFRNIGMALLTLFRCSTGEGWDKIMLAVADQQRGGNRASYLYFVAFLTLSTHIVLNLFVMVLIDNFDQVFRAQDEGTEGMTDDELREFKAVWSIIDPHGTGWIPAYRIHTILRELMPPLGVGYSIPGREVTYLHFAKYLEDLDMNVFRGHVQYRSLLLGLHKVGYGDVMSEETEMLLSGARFTLRSTKIHPVQPIFANKYSSLKMVNAGVRNASRKMKRLSYNFTTSPRLSPKNGIPSPSATSSSKRQQAAAEARAAVKRVMAEDDVQQNSNAPEVIETPTDDKERNALDAGPNKRGSVLAEQLAGFSRNSIEIDSEDKKIIAKFRDRGLGSNMPDTSGTGSCSMVCSEKLAHETEYAALAEDYKHSLFKGLNVHERKGAHKYVREHFAGSSRRGQ